MMAHYKTCKGCVLSSNCAKRNAIKTAIKGLGITVVKHRCDDRTTIFKTGERVAFEWMHYGDPQPPYGEAEDTKFAVTATIMDELSSTRYLVRVDDGPFQEATRPDDYDRIPASELFPRANYLPLLKVKTSDLKRLAEPSVNICASCGGIDGVDMGDRCPRSDFIKPSPCKLEGN